MKYKLLVNDKSIRGDMSSSVCITRFLNNVYFFLNLIQLTVYALLDITNCITLSLRLLYFSASPMEILAKKTYKIFYKQIIKFKLTNIINTSAKFQANVVIILLIFKQIPTVKQMFTKKIK